MGKMGKAGRTTYVGMGVFVIVIAGVILLMVMASFKIGFFAVSPSVTVPTALNTVFTVFGNSSKHVLPAGSPVGLGFIVTSAASITNVSNVSYAIGSAVGGDALLTLNGTVSVNNFYEADILVGINGSTSGLTIPVFTAANGTLPRSEFQITSMKLVGLGLNKGVILSAPITEQPTVASTPANYVFSGVLGKGLYMLEIGIQPSQSYKIAIAATTLGIYNIGGSTVGLSVPALAESGATITNFQINWQN